MKNVGLKLQGMRRIKNYYSGASYYALAYTLFISLEFALHDFLIERISEATGSSEESIVNLMLKDDVDIEQKPQDHSAHHHWHNELVSSFTAGCIAALVTNGIETVAVNKQTNPSLTLSDILFHNSMRQDGEKK